MDQVTPLKELIVLGAGSSSAHPLIAMLRINLMQIGFDYSDPAMEEALYETAILLSFRGRNLERIPDESSILNLRRQLETYELAGGTSKVINGYLRDRSLMLRQGTLVEATTTHAPSSTNNKHGKLDPEMRQT